MTEYGKVGLVLSGGGAKGAYQVGVLRALVELKIPVHVMSGASIGALNGAVLASAPSLEDGLANLQEIWSELAKDSPVKLKSSSYLQLLSAAGLRNSLLVSLARSLIIAGENHGLPVPDKLHQAIHSNMLDDSPLKALLKKHINQDRLSTGIPFYVSIFKSAGGLADAIGYIASTLGIKETKDSEFIHIQSKPIEERRDLLLASAAIPLAYAPKQVNGSIYSDGGQGGAAKAQGNTPIAPLIDMRCDVVIVTHLSDGSLWSRQDFPDTTIVEIRPQSNLARDGSLNDLLGFDDSKIESWIEQGYLDTKHCLGQIIQAGKARQNLKVSEQSIIASEKGNIAADDALGDALKRLN